MSDFRQQLRALIERHIAPASPYHVYINVQIALQQELIRLDRETDRFSDDEMQDGWAGIDDSVRWVDLDQREIQ